MFCDYHEFCDTTVHYHYLSTKKQRVKVKIRTHLEKYVKSIDREQEDIKPRLYGSQLILKLKESINDMNFFVTRGNLI